MKRNAKTGPTKAVWLALFAVVLSCVTSQAADRGSRIRLGPILW